MGCVGRCGVAWGGIGAGVVVRVNGCEGHRQHRPSPKYSCGSQPWHRPPPPLGSKPSLSRTLKKKKYQEDNCYHITTYQGGRVVPARLLIGPRGEGRGVERQRDRVCGGLWVIISVSNGGVREG